MENSWLWVRDIQLREDVHRYRERNWVQVFAGIRTVALKLWRLNGFLSIADVTEHVSHNDAPLCAERPRVTWTAGLGITLLGLLLIACCWAVAITPWAAVNWPEAVPIHRH